VEDMAMFLSRTRAPLIAIKWNNVTTTLKTLFDLFVYNLIIRPGQFLTTRSKI
jgi:hypothetical protein